MARTSDTRPSVPSSLVTKKSSLSVRITVILVAVRGGDSRRSDFNGNSKCTRAS
jgi:hypothetical protein